jgi:hypothetical protein
MNVNMLFIPVLFLAAAFFWLGTFWSRSAVQLTHRMIIFFAGLLLAIPALLFDFYYLHLFDNAQWFYVYRAWPYTELSASGLGLIAGVLYARQEPKTSSEKCTIPVILFLFLMPPFIKPILGPIDPSRLNDRWNAGVCLQSTLSSCGPSSAATILKIYGKAASEMELAKECFTSQGGTENWYLARAIRRRGLRANFQIQASNPIPVPIPSIAGVILHGGAGHFIALLGETPTQIIIGDPLKGRLVFEKKDLVTHYRFTGFFSVVRPRI